VINDQSVLEAGVPIHKGHVLLKMLSFCQWEWLKTLTEACKGWFPEYVALLDSFLQIYEFWALRFSFVGNKCLLPI